MKIPTYRRQTGLPKAAPGQFLSVQADPGKLGAPAAGLAGLGSTVQTEGLRWFGHLLKTERATKQATAEYEFGTALNQTIANAQSQNPAEAWEGRGATEQRAFVENALQMNAQKQATGISDSVVRRRFLTSANKSIIAAMPTIGTHLNNNYRDYSEAAWDLKQNTAVRTIASMVPGAARDLAIEDMVKGLMFTGESRGWGPKAINKAIVGALSDIDHHEARTDLARAIAGGPDGTGDPVLLVGKVLDDLRTGGPDGKRYRNLDISKAAALISSGERRLGTLATNQLNAALKKARDEEAFINIEQEKEYERLHAVIDKARAWQLANPGAVLPDDVPMLTTADLRMMVDRKINPAQKDILRRKIEGEDEINNTRAVADFNDRITNAYTEEDLSYLEKEVSRQYQSGIIGGKAHRVLKSNIKAIKGNTPRADRIKTYERNLRTIFGDKPGGLHIPGQRTADNDIELSGAMIQYHAAVGRGVRPAQAFYEALDVHFTRASSEKTIAVSIVRSLPSSIQNALGITNIRDFGTNGTIKVDDLTLENLSAARRAWARYASGVLPEEVKRAEEVVGADKTLAQLTPKEVRGLGLDKEERIGVADLYAMESSLSHLGRIIQRYGPDPKLNPPPEHQTEVNPNTGELEQTTASKEEEEGWLDAISDNWGPLKRFILDRLPEKTATEQHGSRGAGTN